MSTEPLVFSLGNFAECAGPDYQLHWIIENAGLVRAADGLSSAIVALKDACARHDAIARAMRYVNGPHDSIGSKHTSRSMLM